MVIAVDVGTSSARASAYAVDGRAISALYHQVPYEPRVTADGGVEHDPGVLLAAVATCLDAVCARGGRAAVRAVGVTTFWHGLCGFDAAGQAVTPVFTWADSRSARDAGLLRDALDEAGLHARTGCHLHSSYWPAKLRWFARERPAEARRIARWGSFGEHLELTLFGEAATSVSMASATGLFDVAAGTWDAEALAAAGVETRHLFRAAARAEPRRGGRALARHRPARDRARRPGGGRAAPGARLSVAGATRRARAPHRRLRWRRHPLARVDANARGCARPPGDVVARAGDHQSRRRAAGVARAGRAPRPRRRPRAARRDLRTRSRAARALPRRARPAARVGRKGMISFMDATAQLPIAADPSALPAIAAQEVLAVARAAVAAHGRFTVALAGGP